MCYVFHFLGLFWKSPLSLVVNVVTVVRLVFVVECSQWPSRVGGVDCVSVVNIVGGVVVVGAVTVTSQCSWWLVGEVDVVDVVSVVV